MIVVIPRKNFFSRVNLSKNVFLQGPKEQPRLMIMNFVSNTNGIVHWDLLFLTMRYQLFSSIIDFMYIKLTPFHLVGN